MTPAKSNAILLGALVLSVSAVFPDNVAAKAGVVGPSWTSSHLELLKDAELGHSSAERKLRDCVQTPKHCDDFETGAVLILVSQADRKLGAGHAWRLLDIASKAPSERFWLAELAAETLMLAGDDRAWRAEVASTPHPLLRDAWLRSRLGDFSGVPLIESSLSARSSAGDYRCAAAGFLDSAILRSANGRALVDRLIDRLQDGYENSTMCAAWAIRRNWGDMDDAARQRIHASLLALFGADDRDRNTQGVRIAAVLLEKLLPDTVLSSAVVRLASTSEDRLLWNEVNDLATMLNFVGHPIHMSDEQREARDTIVATSGGNGLFPWEWLWQQEFDRDWTSAASQMTDAELIEFLRYGVEHHGEIRQIRAKTDALVRTGRVGDSLIARYWLAELLTMISDRRADPVGASVYSAADALGQTSLATRYPKQFAATTARFIWATALEERDDWRYLAALANAADFCHVSGVVGGKRLRDPDVMPAYARVLAMTLDPCLFNIVHNAGTGESLPTEGIASDVTPMPDAVYPALLHGIIVEVNYISAESISRDALHMALDGTDFTRDCFFDAFHVACETSATLTMGRHHISAAIGDLRKLWSFEAATAPAISELLPKGGTQFELSDRPVVRAKFCSTRALQQGDLTATLDAIDVVQKIDVKVGRQHCGELTFAPELPLAVGNHLFEMKIHGEHDFEDTRSTNFIIQPVRQYSVVVLSPKEGEVEHEPDVLVQVASSANRSEPNELTINGALARVRSFDERPWVYIIRVPLNPGVNDLNIRAGFEDGESRTVQRQIRYDGKSTK